MATTKKNSNIRGRPNKTKTINFSPLPKSTISQLLNKIKKSGPNSQSMCQLKRKQYLEMKNDNTIVPLLPSELLPNCKPQCEVKTVDFKDPLQSSHEEINVPFDCEIVDNDNGNVNDSQKSQYLTMELSASPFFQRTEKEIACQICSNKSQGAKDHKEHMIMHRNEEGYFCNYPDCKYTCKLSSNLIKHKKIHTSEKPYLCDQCSFRSNFINSLKVHKRIHSAERPYKCKYCLYKCNSSSNLKKHCSYRHKDTINNSTTVLP